MLDHLILPPLRIGPAIPDSGAVWGNQDMLRLLEVEQKPFLLGDVPSFMLPSVLQLRHYADRHEVDTQDYLTKFMTAKAASSVVGLSSFTGEEFLYACSGTIVRWDDTHEVVLTSASLLLRNADVVPTNIVVKVHLPDGDTVCGSILSFDVHHNIAAITLPSAKDLHLPSLVLDPKPFILSGSVVALGRDFVTSDLVVSVGEILIKDLGFDSEDVVSSSCIIKPNCIGGPLIDLGSGSVIGMNFSDGESTVFLPSIILLRCLKHFQRYRKVLRPWLGLRTQDLNALKIAQLERIYQKFPDVDGVYVDKVMKGSPADTAGLCAGDIITHCGGTVVCSPLKFVDLLFEKVEESIGPSCNLESDSALGKIHIPIEITFHRENTGCIETKILIVDKLQPLKNNRWPLCEGFENRWLLLSGNHISGNQ